jgi:hypothetical protein
MAGDGFDYALEDSQGELWSFAEAVLSAGSLEAAQAAARELLEACKEAAVSIRCRSCRREVAYADRAAHRGSCREG